MRGQDVAGRASVAAVPQNTHCVLGGLPEGRLFCSRRFWNLDLEVRCSRAGGVGLHPGKLAHIKFLQKLGRNSQPLFEGLVHTSSNSF